MHVYTVYIYIHIYQSNKPAPVQACDIITLIDATEQPGVYQLLPPSTSPPDDGFKSAVKQQTCFCHCLNLTLLK